jgi:hypothetical protein
VADRAKPHTRLWLVVALRLELRGPRLVAGSVEGGCELELTVVDTGKDVRTGLLTKDKLKWANILPHPVLLSQSGGLRFWPPPGSDSDDIDLQYAPMLRVGRDVEPFEADPDARRLTLKLSFLVSRVCLPSGASWGVTVWGWRGQVSYDCHWVNVYGEYNWVEGRSRLVEALKTKVVWV